MQGSGTDAAAGPPSSSRVYPASEKKANGQERRREVGLRCKGRRCGRQCERGGAEEADVRLGVVEAGFRDDPVLLHLLRTSAARSSSVDWSARTSTTRSGEAGPEQVTGRSRAVTQARIRSRSRRPSWRSSPRGCGVERGCGSLWRGDAAWEEFLTAG